MAEGTTFASDKVICRFFLTSTCRDGDRCLFSHDSSRTIPDQVCRFYLQGRCYFGESCRYDHVSVKKLEARSRVDKPSRCDPSVDCTPSDARNTSKESCGRKEEGEEYSSGDEYVLAPENWVKAPEFVPRSQLSYAAALRANIAPESDSEMLASTELCPLFMLQVCPREHQCPYVHGDVCELCNKACLHPYNEAQRKAHVEECERELELNMELSFAVQRSLGKTCGICMDVVLDKEPFSERRFGILENCNHVFCLQCIRQWRESRRQGRDRVPTNAVDPFVTRACPECRISSAFVIPSSYVVEDGDEKKKLIAKYKAALSKKPCKYFKMGRGTCPFGGACFYLHARPDGTKVELPLPTRRRRQNEDGELQVVTDVYLSHFLEDDDFIFYETDDDDDDDDVDEEDEDEDDDDDNSIDSDLEGVRAYYVSLFNLLQRN